MLDLGTLGGSDSYGYAVNAAGQVVGLSYVAPEVSNYSHAFLYTPNSGMIDLNTMINPLSGWELLDSDDINDLGQVTGQGLFNGEYRAYLLTPATLLDGDFNGDGSVNSADLTNWQAGFGTSSDATHLAGDADGDLDVDGADFLAWQRQLGSPSCAPATAAVPEPATLLSLVLAMSAIILRRRVAVTSTHASMIPVPAGRYSEYGRQKGCAIARPGRTVRGM
jgi:probable HAF family extracellular repeat protein